MNSTLRHMFRHVLLHVDSSEQSLARLQAARALARLCEADLTALYAVTPWLLLYPTAALDAAGGTGLGAVATQLSEWDKQRQQQTRARFAPLLDGQPTARWVELGGETPYDFVTHALYADLLVLGQRSPADPARDDVPSDFISHVIVGSGKPALVVPHRGSSAEVPRKVLMAWNASREAARALHFALPLLQQAEVVHVAAWTRAEAAPTGDAAAVSRHLQRHGITPILHEGHHGEGDVAPALLALAADVAADLLVMGCYGHSRAREWVLGGTTRSILEETTLPVFMAH